MRKFKIIDRPNFNISNDNEIVDNEYILVQDLLTHTILLAKANGCNLKIGQIITYKDVDIIK